LRASKFGSNRVAQIFASMKMAPHVSHPHKREVFCDVRGTARSSTDQYLTMQLASPKHLSLNKGLLGTLLDIPEILIMLINHGVSHELLF